MAEYVTVVVGPDGKLTIKAIDLIGDLWDDCQYFMSEAKATERSADLHAMNRSLRAALVCLMAHTEGIVSGIVAKLIETDDFRRHCNNDKIADACFTDKVKALRTYATKRSRARIAFLDIRTKALRDVLVHPGIERVYRTPTRTDTVKDPDLYDITVSSLEADRAAIDNWLEHLCRVYEYPRIRDTEATIRDLEKALGGYGIGVERDKRPTRI